MTRLRYTFLLPVLLAGVTGGFIGWTVMRISCGTAPCSPFSTLAVGLLSGLVAAAGVGIVVVLADRSLREWNEWRAGGEEQAGGDTPDTPDATREE